MQRLTRDARNCAACLRGGAPSRALQPPLGLLRGRARAQGFGPPSERCKKGAVGRRARGEGAGAGGLAGQGGGAREPGRRGRRRSGAAEAGRRRGLSPRGADAARHGRTEAGL